MNLPTKIEMRRVSLVDGHNGFKEERWRNHDFGVESIYTRESYRSPWEQVWLIDSQPGIEFLNYEALRKAVMIGQSAA